MLSPHSALPKARTFRDPVHDIISWKPEGDIGRILCALIDSAEVQRLRFIRQLGLANLVYHGAEHSRFAHSLGVAHIARRMAHQLEVDDEQRLIVIAAALLHDVGHAPFSHVMERIFSFHHEDYSAAILLDPECEVHQRLAQVDPALPNAVVDRVSGTSPHWTRDILSSQLDADRADYLLRDAHMAGIAVGRYDLERLLLMLGHDDQGLFVHIGGYETVEGYLMARYHMYRLVYFHRGARAAETMLGSTIARATRLAEQGDRTVLPGGTLERLMRGEEVNAAAWVRFQEFDVWAAIHTWADHRDNVLARLAQGLLRRQLFACNERSATPNGPGWWRDAKLAEDIQEALTPNERALFVVDEAGDVPYRPYTTAAGTRGLRVRDHDGKLFYIEERSHVARALADATYRIRRWFYHPSLEGKLRRLAGPDW